ncbi:hypothetical protein A6U86_05705 [Rhizobium sp. AC27/96]|uniref:hypothetical protein n=1 Tax=Rhizobium sp. AC27/96 TaxID=1841653 RepID=UPI000828D68E|nr:hypothetical protein [Rhizobium sp. AC27/96]OCJ12518.1 hypothetical protein A6U86_05705 [Rhizobium sp. AC27/96]
MVDKKTAVLDLLRLRAKTMNGAHPVGAGDGKTYVPNYYGSSDQRLDRQAIEVIEELEAKLAEAEGFAMIVRKANGDLSDLLIENGILVPQRPTMEDILREQLENPNSPRLPKSSYANRSEGGFVSNAKGDENG